MSNAEHIINLRVKFKIGIMPSKESDCPRAISNIDTIIKDINDLANIINLSLIVLYNSKYQLKKNDINSPVITDNATISILN